MTVNVLGTKYSINCKSPSEDKFLRECDGYHAGICLRAHEALKEVKEE